MMEQLNLYLFRRNDRVRRIKPNSKITLSYFQNRRWQLVTLLEQLSGFWPYQSKLQQYPLQLLHSFILLTVISALGNKLREYVAVNLIDSVAIECCLLMFIFIAIFIKLIFASIHQYTRRKVYEKIAKHFVTMSDPAEVAVLNEAAERGFKYTLHYLCIISAVVITFSGVPFLRAFYDYFFTDHELRAQLPAPMNYGFDHNKYWYIIALHFLMGISSGLLVVFTYDFSFVLQVRHVAAFFKIVGIRLRKATVPADELDESYSLISSAIDLHSECFKVVKLIEKSHSASWFIVLLLSTAGFGAAIHVISTKLHDPIDTFRYATGFMMAVIHFHVVFSQGQMIIDSAKSVSDACCECKWYGFANKITQTVDDDDDTDFDPLPIDRSEAVSIVDGII